MERRFWTFEHLLLNSLKAQTDQNFRFVVLTSKNMPADMQTRLANLCATVHQIELVVSEEEHVNDALLPVIERYEEGLSERLVQFRIDDDDCLGTDYIARLNAMAQRMKGITPFAYSRARGLVRTAYSDHPEEFFELKRPYHSAGAAVRPQPGKTIYSFGHFALLKRFTGVVDWQSFGSLAMKYDGHDSEIIKGEEARKPFLTAISPEHYSEIVSKRLPFLEKVPFEELNRLLAAQEDVSQRRDLSQGGHLTIPA